MRSHAQNAASLVGLSEKLPTWKTTMRQVLLFFSRIELVPELCNCSWTCFATFVSEMETSGRCGSSGHCGRLVAAWSQCPVSDSVPPTLDEMRWSHSEIGTCIVSLVIHVSGRKLCSKSFPVVVKEEPVLSWLCRASKAFYPSPAPQKRLTGWN